MSNLEFLRTLENIIDERIRSRSPESYTYRLVSQGVGKICKKVLEEAGEVVVAALHEDRLRFIEECADLIYHLLVLMRVKDVSIEDVCEVLIKRHIAKTGGQSTVEK